MSPISPALRFSAAAFLAIAALSIIACAPAHAGTGAGPTVLTKLDRDGDGRISRAEASAAPRLSQKFDQLDTDKDGYLSRSELKAAHQKLMQKRFAKIDADHDGRISRAEAQSGAPRLAKHFDAIDTNRDGYLSKEELIAAREKLIRARHAQRKTPE